MSDEIMQSLQIDEQIANHEHYLQELKKKRDQMSKVKPNDPVG